ncbi:hypothetical protein Hdeb2414_s0026g00682141 [Helianthus debilis subsp. tardiflorus]
MSKNYIASSTKVLMGTNLCHCHVCISAATFLGCDMKGLFADINRGAWFITNSSLGKPLLTNLPPLHHQYNTIIHHIPPSSIFRVCVVISGSKIDIRVLVKQMSCLAKSLTSLGEDKSFMYYF